jgi:hypothetical protein
MMFGYSVTQTIIIKEEFCAIRFIHGLHFTVGSPVYSFDVIGFVFDEITQFIKPEIIRRTHNIYIIRIKSSLIMLQLQWSLIRAVVVEMIKPVVLVKNVELVLD